MLTVMLMIRLARVGKRGHATFRIVVTEHTRPAKSGSLVSLGSYDPHTKKVQVNADRLKFYLSNGAQASPTVHNLLVGQKLIEGTKVAAWKAPKKEVPAAASTGEKPAAPAAPPTDAEKPVA
ncbi:MAG: 30S ribosomal protein S16 [Parcubacteria group bacterium Gr01-1014_106]|nr:MAG: 30S ribosomal protein S16 [Parcubacteria group bacterium Gr01-1014_106]